MSRKNTVALLAGLLIFLAAAAPAGPAGAITVTLNGKELAAPVEPKDVNGTLYVPLKEIAAVFGAQAAWNDAVRAVTVERENMTARFFLNRTDCTVNGAAVALKSPPCLFGGRTYIPLEAVRQLFAVEADWNAAARILAFSGPVLPSVGSFANLRRLLAEADQIGGGIRRQANIDIDFDLNITATMEDSAEKAAAPAAGAEAEYSKADYSDTNVQVRGVDEADILKTDGEYIYQINRNRILVIKASPAAAMEVADTVEFDEKEFTPREIYIDAGHLVVIGASYDVFPFPADGARPAEPQDKAMIYPPYRRTGTVKALIYDLTDKSDLKQLREVELEGHYVSSRKIGSCLYLIANKHLDWYYIMEQSGEEGTPVYRDTAGGGEFTALPYSDIRYFPGSVEPNYLLVAGLDLAEPESEMAVSAYLGSGQNIYASPDSLYVAVTQYKAPGKEIIPAENSIAVYRPAQVTTGVYKFALDNGSVRHRGQGEVPGTILNQFSMDEHAGHFRIATTGHKRLGDETVSTNNVYILDSAMDITGKIEDIAPGERIYSVRFLGDRGYVVTFKNVDPLFVIDLKDPAAPAILGVLKIPGYSDYLHPYDENHLIGFGKDTIELSQKDWEGRETGTMAFYQGMKLAVFDVTDVTRPKELFKEIIGDRGTDSELLHNHKALLFDKEKSLLAFPVTVLEIKNPVESDYGFPQYGEFAFQGAYVYNLDLENGFDLEGRITHLAADDYQKSGYGGYYGDLAVERIIYIGDVLYTLSQGKIKANSLNDLSEIATLTLPR